MTDWAALKSLAEQVDGICLNVPGDVPVVTHPGSTCQVVAEHEGYDIWHVGREMRLVATGVSAEVAAEFLRRTSS